MAGCLCLDMKTERFVCMSRIGAAPNELLPVAEADVLLSISAPVTHASEGNLPLLI
jgi:hypothetical protein